MVDSARLFVDTWGWLVLANDRDPAFQQVAALRSVAERSNDASRAWITTDYVLDETLTRLFAAAPFAKAKQFCEGIFEASQTGFLDIEYVTPKRFQAAWHLRVRYKDKPRISFTDLTSFVVMKELGLHRAITGDVHFEQVELGFRRLPGR